MNFKHFNFKNIFNELFSNLFNHQIDVLEGLLYKY